MSTQVRKALLVAVVVAALVAVGVAGLVTGTTSATGFIVTSAIAITAAVIALVWLLPTIQSDAWPPDLEAKDRIELRDKTRSTIGQLVGAVALVATVAITLVSANNTRDVSQETFDLAARGQANDRFAKAVEELGARDSKNRRSFEVRLGGIYLLEQFAIDRDSTFGRVKAVGEILSAYVRTNSPRAHFDAGQLPAKAPCVPDRRYLAPDVQAALDILREIYPKGRYQTPPGLNLADADLSGADLHSMDLREANLNGARLFLADLDGADLDSADLGGVDARSACFLVATARMTHFDGIGQADAAEIRKQAADLRGAAFLGTDLTGAEMSYVDLRGADLAGANFTGATVGAARMEGTNPDKVKAGRSQLPCGGPNPPCP